MRTDVPLPCLLPGIMALGTEFHTVRDVARDAAVNDEAARNLQRLAFANRFFASTHPKITPSQSLSQRQKAQWAMHVLPKR